LAHEDPDEGAVIMERSSTDPVPGDQEHPAGELVKMMPVQVSVLTRLKLRIPLV
jgi:hypothetical protein